MKSRIAIIGAGISGLTLAQEMKDHYEVIVYEKARGVGGRMSTRHSEPFYFDHGTQCFTARTQEFRAFLRPFLETGIICEWKGKVITLEPGKKQTKRIWFEPHLVATPNMNSLCKKLAEGMEIRLLTEVARLPVKTSKKWLLTDVAGNHLGEFDWVISTAPPAQTLKLFPDKISPDSSLHTARMQGCYALLIGLQSPWEKKWIAAKVCNSPIKWISINSTKPNRSQDVTAVVAHSHNDWAELHINDTPEHIQSLLLEQFERVTEIPRASLKYVATHRWRYAIVEETQQSGFFIDPICFLAATSDWASTSRIEEVWCNAKKLADRLIKFAINFAQI